MSEVNVFMSTSDDDKRDQLLQMCSWKSQTQMVGSRVAMVTTTIMYCESISGVVVRYCLVSHR